MCESRIGKDHGRHRQKNNTLLEAQHPPDHRHIEGDQQAIHRVSGLGVNASANQENHQHRRQGDGEKGGEKHGECLGEGERLKEPSFLSLEGEYRQERDRDDQQRVKKRLSHLLCGLDDNLIAAPMSAFLFPSFQTLVGIFHHDDRRIDHGANSNGDPSKGHDIGGQVQVVHGDKRDDDGDGEGENGHQCASDMKKKDQADNTHNDAFFNQFFFQRGDRFQDEVRTVIGGHDLYALRKRRLDLLELFLYPVDQIKGILAIAHDHNATHNLALAVQLGYAAPHIRPQSHSADVSHQDRGAPAIAPHGDHLDILYRLDVAPAAHHVLRPAELDRAAADVVVAHADGIHDALDREAIGCQAVWVQVYLILADESAQACHFRDPFDAADLIAKIPVLQAAELSQIMFAGFIHQSVLKDPAHSRCIRPESRRNPAREPVRHLV